MQAAASQIIRVRRGDDSVPQRVGPRCDARARGSSPAYAYYFLMQQVGMKRGARLPDLRMLVAFGPFNDPHTARFIRASARFLGLVEDAAAPTHCLRIDEPQSGLVTTPTAASRKQHISNTRPRTPLASLQPTPSFHT